MSWFEIAVLVLLALIWWDVSAALRAMRGSIIAASDLNLEAHKRLLGEVHSATLRMDREAELERAKSDPDSWWNKTFEAP